MEYAIIFLPLLGSVIGYFGKSLAKFFSEVITSLFVSISAILSIIVFWNGIEKNNYKNHIIFEWISSGDFIANWSINIDPLSSVMLIVVTFVSALVHIYSIGYMSHDPHKPRFMSYLSLFTFSMLALVVSDNFLQLFFGWEGVGLCSYLLIGFWYKKEAANKAAIKAFVVNRVGDFGLAIGIFLIFLYWCHGEICSIFITHLVARRNGRSNTCISFNPCRYYGNCGSFSCRKMFSTF